MDRRQQRTRQAIFDAFAGLLEEKAYSKITVQDIIDRANIGRSTFYSHFETKDVLLEALCSEIFDDVFTEVLTKEKTKKICSAEDMAESITAILYHVKDNECYIGRILSSESGEVLIRTLREYMVKRIEDEMEAVELDVPLDFLANHIVCDFAETVRWWMKHRTYSPEEISGFYLNALPRSWADAVH